MKYSSRNLNEPGMSLQRRNPFLRFCGVCMGSYLASLPDTIAVQFTDYLEALVKSEGSMPLVRPFVVDFNSEQEIRLRKQTVEPKVERLRGGGE